MEELELVEHENIKGLYFCKNIITKEEEKQIIEDINKQTWLSDLRRRVQHYGYKYDYKKRRIDKEDKLGDLPDWTVNIESKIFKLIDDKKIKLSYNKFDQLIVNEYMKNQGISAHTDCVPCFRNGIVTVTVGNKGVMTFRRGEESYDIKLSRRSVAILTDEARYKWTHEINPSKNDNFTNDKPRISLTFRKCII